MSRSPRQNGARTAGRTIRAGSFVPWIATDFVQPDPQLAQGIHRIAGCDHPARRAVVPPVPVIFSRTVNLPSNLGGSVPTPDWETTGVEVFQPEHHFVGIQVNDCAEWAAHHFQFPSGG